MKWEDFKRYRERTTNVVQNARRVDIQCPECNDDLYVRTDIVLSCYPPKSQYFCNKCGWVGTA